MRKDFFDFSAWKSKTPAANPTNGILRRAMGIEAQHTGRAIRGAARRHDNKKPDAFPHRD